jgi:hypothetical protein
VKGAHLVERGALEVGHVAERAVLIGEVAPIGERVAAEVREHVGPVLIRLAALLHHDLPLGLEVLAGDGQRAHAVGFEKEAEREVVRGQGLGVAGAVLVGAPVERPAVRGDQPKVLALADVCAALEHHVLEEVREARVLRLLHARAHVVVDLNGDRGRGVVGREHHAQPVVQTLGLHRDGEFFGARGRGDRRSEREREERERGPHPRDDIPGPRETHA